MAALITMYAFTGRGRRTITLLGTSVRRSLAFYAAPMLTQVQLPGDGFRMRADVLKREFAKGGLLQDTLLRYTQAFITQIAQTAACNRAHPIEGRPARWLLMCEDRANAKDLQLTHEFISEMLGIRRAGVTEAPNLLREGLCCKKYFEARRCH